MKWTGHSDYQAMKPYIGIAEKTNHRICLITRFFCIISSNLMQINVK